MIKRGNKASSANNKNLAPWTERPWLIAELGTAHLGDPELAAELIHAAAESGADCLKFQIVIAEEILHPNTGFVDLPSGRISLFERFLQLEQSPDFYAFLAEETRKKGCEPLFSVFGFKSLELLKNTEQDRLRFIKIASPELNYLQLIKAAAKSCERLILSTGVSLDIDIEQAVAANRNSRDYRSPNRLPENSPVLLHCVTSYPAPETDYNLRLLQWLSNRFKCPIGVSDHSAHPWLIPVLSLTTGGRIIEKHFTLSKETDGLDDPIAITPREFSELKKRVTQVWEDYKVNDSFQQFMYELENDFSKAYIDQILGDGIKRLAPSEKQNYGRTNRSVHALTDLPAGTVLTSKNTAVLRTEKNLSPGATPVEWDSLIGKKLIKPVSSGMGINIIDVA